VFSWRDFLCWSVFLSPSDCQADSPIVKNWCESTVEGWRKSNEEKIGLAALVEKWHDAMTSSDMRAEANGDPRPEMRVKLYKDIVAKAEDNMEGIRRFLEKIATPGNEARPWDWENDVVSVYTKYMRKHSGLLILFSFRNMRSCKLVYNSFKNL